MTTDVGAAMNIVLIENGCEENLARRIVKQYEEKCAEVAQLMANSRENKLIAESCERDRKAAVAALAAQDGVREAWQPIETAPKDGARILLYEHPRGAFEDGGLLTGRALKLIGWTIRTASQHQLTGGRYCRLRLEQDGRK